MITSKFKFSVILPFIVLILGSTLIYKIIFDSNKSIKSSFVLIFVTSLMILVIIMILFSELKLKIIKITINNQFLTINRYCGFGKKIIINNNTIDGFYRSEVYTKYGIYNYIYIMSNGKKVAKISNQYHTNYIELNRIISSKYKKLGNMKSGFISEIKDIFN